VEAARVGLMGPLTIPDLLTAIGDLISASF
jgi:hypothetical protein